MNIRICKKCGLKYDPDSGKHACPKGTKTKKKKEKEEDE